MSKPLENRAFTKARIDPDIFRNFIKKALKICRNLE